MLPAKTKRRYAREPGRGPPVSVSRVRGRVAGKIKARAFRSDSALHHQGPGGFGPHNRWTVSTPVTLFLLSQQSPMASFSFSPIEMITTSTINCSKNCARFFFQKKGLHTFWSIISQSVELHEYSVPGVMRPYTNCEWSALYCFASTNEIFVRKRRTNTRLRQNIPWIFEPSDSSAKNANTY
jgi:hypothetical protein